jgi:hypothetical protein
MSHGKHVFSQLMAFLPLSSFRTMYCHSPLRSQGPRVHLHGPVFDDGLCSVDLPRVFARHRGQFACPSQAAVSHGASLQDCFLQHFSQFQYNPALANLHRLRETLDCHDAPYVCQRPNGDRLGCNRLLLRCHDVRPVPVGLSAGTVSSAQNGYQTANSVGPARLHPHIHSHQRRQDPRGQHLGPAAHRAWRVLPARSRVLGFPTTVCDPSGQRLLRHPCQVQYQDQAALLQPRGPSQLEHRVRPDKFADHLLFQPRPSCDVWSSRSRRANE